MVRPTPAPPEDRKARSAVLPDGELGPRRYGKAEREFSLSIQGMFFSINMRDLFKKIS
jgi:hypothetical protein